MDAYNITTHQKTQIEVINKIEQQAKSNTMQFSTVVPVSDYENDSRIALTSVHFPNQSLIQTIQEQILNPLKSISPNHYYYKQDSLHLTIKNVRVINDPPTFNTNDVYKVKKVFDTVIPKHNKFKSYFYKLLVFPSSLSLIGTTTTELDLIHIHLDKELEKVGVPDNKQYLNSQYFFSNITLVRFTSTITKEYRDKINRISNSIIYKPYEVNSVTLLSCNAVLSKQHIIGSWNLI